MNFAPEQQMQLSTLLKQSEGITLIAGGDEVAVSGIVLDSRQVRPGDLFAVLAPALAGGADKRRDYGAQAVEKGAIALLAGEDIAAEMAQKWPHICVLSAADDRAALAALVAGFYQDIPANIIAVTGTNGKTSVAHFARQLLAKLYGKAASIGTLGAVVEGVDVTFDAPALTTPDVVSLYRILTQLKQAGMEHVVMEASSIGLEQQRLGMLQCAAAAFTNFSHDHLDYHGTMAHYFDAKMLLFTRHLKVAGLAVLQGDLQNKIVPYLPEGVRVLSYGSRGDITLKKLTPTPHGMTVMIAGGGKEYSFKLPLIGGFQAENILCAMGLVMGLGHDVKTLVGLVPKLTAVAGRMEPVIMDESGMVLVDYAHTPDALEKALQAARPHVAKDGRLHVLFGCGGNRDAAKRPEMGALAQVLADKVIVTDDNPRFEAPAAIRREILAACPKAEEVADRAAAIKAALLQLQPGDVLLVAGKGHEEYQEIEGVKYPFDDAAMVRELWPH